MPRVTKKAVDTAAADAAPALAAESGTSTVLVVPPAKKYTEQEADAILKIAIGLLGSLPYGTHDDVYVNRAAIAFAQAERILPLYQLIVNKDADNGQA